MDFCEHRAATAIAEFDDARAEKLKKKSNFHNTDFLIFYKRRSWSKKVIYHKRI